MKPVIFGEAPSQGTARPFAGRSGDRLRSLAGVEKLEDHFLVRNLRATPMQPGEQFVWRRYVHTSCRYLELLRQARPPVTLLMGRNVEAAFLSSAWGNDRRAYLVSYTYWGLMFVVFPHPSGLNHWWNDWDNVARATEFLRGVVRDHG